MIAFYPLPKLRQRLVSAPTVLLGTERLNSGYRGAMLRVRRASDSVTKECYSLADVVSHCTGTDGFVNVAYDQSGSGRDYSQGTAGKQPKIYDSSTGLSKTGPLVGLSTVTANSQCLGRADNSGLPNTGNPAITTLLVCGRWSNTSPPNPVAFAVGNDASVGANPEKWYLGRSLTPTIFLSLSGGVAIHWTPSPEPTSDRACFVISKASGVNASASVCRENKNALPTATVAGGTMALSSSGISRWGCSSNGGSNADSQFATMESSLLAHFNAVLSAADLSAAEQYMHRMVTAG